MRGIRTQPTKSITLGTQKISIGTLANNQVQILKVLISSKPLMDLDHLTDARDGKVTALATKFKLAQVYSVICRLGPISVRSIRIQSPFQRLSSWAHIVTRIEQ